MIQIATFMSETCPHSLQTTIFVFQWRRKRASERLGSLFGFPLVSTQHAAPVLDKCTELWQAADLAENISWL